MAEASKQAERSYLNRLIADAPFFKGAAEDDLAELARHARSLAFVRGKPITTAKGKPPEVYLIITGAAALLERDETSDRSTLIALMGPGDIVGLVQACEYFTGGSHRHNSLWRALSNVTTVAIPTVEFNRITRRSPELTSAYISALGRAVRNVTARFTAALLHPLEMRLAAFLEEMATIAAGNGWDPTANLGRLQQTQIAEMLGVSREHINRTLTMWERSGLIFQSKSGDLIVENRKRLAELAGFRRPRAAPLTETDRLWEIETHINLGLNAAAYDLAIEGAKRAPKDERFKYFAVLAMARMGSLSEALTLAEGFGLSTESKNEDIASIVPRLKRDLALASVEHDKSQLKSAAEGFEKVFAALGTIYPGVNAAATWAMCGNRERARKLSKDVSQLAAAVLDGVDDDETSYWTRATLAECRLIGGDKRGAQAGFVAAAHAADAAPGKIATTRKQLRRLRAAVGIDDAWIDNALPQGQVLFYCGPLTPAGVAQTQALDRLRAKVEALLEKRRFTAAIGALAAGADIVVAETLLEAGVPLQAYLPLAPAEFLQSSVLPAAGDWAARYIACVERAQTVDWLRLSKPSHAVYRLGARVAIGRAIRLADDLATTPFGFFSVQNGRNAKNSISIENCDAWRALGLDAEIAADSWLSREATLDPGEGGALRTALVVHGASPAELKRVLKDVEPYAVKGDGIAIFELDGPEAAVEAARTVANSKIGRSVRIWLDAGAGDDFAHSLVTATCRPQTPPGKTFASDIFVNAATARPGLKPAFDYIGYSPTDEKISPCPLYLASI